MATQRNTVPRSFSRVVGQELPVLLAHCDKKLVDAHGRVDGDFSAEKCFDVMFLKENKSCKRYDCAGLQDRAR